MGRKSTSRAQITVLALALILSVSLAHAASFSSTVTNPPLQAGATNQLLNFSVNNADSLQDDNYKGVL